ncbi:MAG: hypothetical protein MJZ13_03125 [Bacteroidales bacterium]|nr:hypothetical protein [Bacteroidales bacterium]
MNNRYKYIMMAAVAGLSLATTSCDEGGLDDLQGVYAAPSDLTVTEANVERKKEGNLRTFVMDIKTTEGANVNVTMLCNNYFLTSNTYTVRDAASAKNGNIVSGVSTVNGSPIVDGSLSLVKNGDDYAVATSVFFTQDGKSYRLKGAFFSEFLPDDPTALSSIKPQFGWDGSVSMYTDNYDGTVTIVFTTGGYEEIPQENAAPIYKGEGNDLQLVIKTTDGKLTPGTYKPGEGYVVGETFMNNAFEAFGVPPFEDFKGSLWYTISDGQRVPQMITTGDIVITKNGPLYSILLDQGKGGVYAEYKGGIGALDPDGDAGEVFVMNSVPSLTNWASFGWGVNFIDIQMANGTVTGTFDETSSSTVYSGDGILVQAEPFSADGKLARGEYNISAEMGPGVAQAGCDNAFSPGSPSGCYVCEVKDGVLGTAVYIPAGSLKIEGEGDDTTIILTAKNSDGVVTATYVFTGNIGL